MIAKMRMGMRKCFTASSLLFSWLSKMAYRAPQEREVDRWFCDRGDKTLGVEYELNQNSLVFDLGGYEGDWTAEIIARYGASVFVFEPVLEYATRIRKRFLKNSRVKVFQFGLGGKDLNQEIHLAEEGSSLFSSPNVPHGNAAVPISIRCAADFIAKESIKQVDLIKINIEGGEYDLLDHLLDTGLMTRVKSVRVQFHNFVPQAEERMAKIQERLSQTHVPTYQYKFVWENWTKKEN